MVDAIIIQARLSSSRFPGKVHARFKDSTLLGYLIDRLRNTGLPIIIAVPSSEQNLWQYFSERHRFVEYFFGSHHDVAKRYIDAAESFGVQNIVRVTGDNPCTSAVLVLRALHKLKEGYEFVSNKWDEGANVPKGFGSEAFTLDGLKRAYIELTNPADREHITELFLSKQFKISIDKDPFNSPNINLRDGFLSVDHEIQLKLLNELLK